MEETAYEIIAFKVLEYLNEYPDAQDTSEGIIAWWLPQVESRYQRAKINTVLKELTAKGVILEHIQSGSSTYKINPSKKGEISALLSLVKHESG